MDTIGQKAAARDFVERWQGRGDEKQDAQSYWRDLLANVLGAPSATLATFVSFERKVPGGWIDVFIEDTGVLIEQKGISVDLEKAQLQSDGALLTPYEQGARYASRLPLSIRPRWIIACNFDRMLIYDQESDPTGKEPKELLLSDLPQELYRLSFILDKSNSRIEKEKTLSIKAGEIVGKLYKSFARQYKNLETDEHEQRSINMLIVRFVFLLYAEDAGLFATHGAVFDYLKPFAPEQMRSAVMELFKVLDTPEDERDTYLPPNLLAFPYINGGLFEDESLIIPQFTDQIKLDLLVEASSKFDWSGVSPTIFGAVFESTLTAAFRREGGMHYTSIANIHKVIDPLFLDGLKAELGRIEGLKSERDRKIKLKALQNKLSSINVFDPACGSGNFLTESYLSLRKLENRAIEGILGDQQAIGFDGANDLIKVSPSQFFGIEINDFAVSVAKTAMWIAESQMVEATQEIVLQVIDFLPLKSNTNIHEGNALRMEWSDVLPAEKCGYICGNPPFIGYKEKSPSQKNDLESVCLGANGRTIKNVGSIDYVSGWYYKAARFMSDNRAIRAALVSTNSITQGEQVFWMWKPLIQELGVVINFAYPTFTWDSEATDKAHVHVVIVGFSLEQAQSKIWSPNDGGWLEASRINPYLFDAADVWIQSRRTPICPVPEIKLGVHLLDNHEFIFSDEEKKKFLAAEPNSKGYFKKWVSANDFLYGKCRWFLDLHDCAPNKLDAMPLCRERVRNVIEYRRGNKSAQGTALEHDAFKTKQGWKADCDYIAVPNTSSERRRYLPLALMTAETVITMPDLAIPGGGLYEFGILSSRLHMLWVAAVCGRLKSDYRYANGIVYNNFPWPDATDSLRAHVEDCSAGVLAARARHEDKTLADLYDPDKMPEDLREAHTLLDKSAEEAYGIKFDGDEEKATAYLFNLYAKMSGNGEVQHG